MMTSDETPAELADRQGLAVFALVASIYTAALAAYRLPTVLSARGEELLPGFPPWIFDYLLGLCVLLLLVATAGGAYAALGLRSNKPPARVGLGIALAIAILVVVHGYVLINHDAAVGEGGMLWGAIHVLTLTREVSPAGSTDSGMAGYRVGQFVGLVAILLWPLALAALARTPTPATEARRPRKT